VAKPYFLSLDFRYKLASIGVHEQVIRDLFRQTFFLGTPVDSEIRHFQYYEDLCLSWYLLHDKQGSVVVIDTESDQVVGYALLCLDPDAYQRWVNRHARRLCIRVMASFVSRRLTATDKAFYWNRALDSLTVVRSRSRTSSSAVPHVHMNLKSDARAGRPALMLLSHVDGACAQAGFDSWVGEINAIEGSRHKAVRRLIGDIEDVVVNRTASYFLNSRVVRMTVRRECGGKDRRTADMRSVSHAKSWD
jgi:hypothetical protein